VEKYLGPDPGLLERLSAQLRFLGVLPHRQALAEVAKADFSIMLRPNARFAQAGFPTKLGESLACGVPVLGNLTGDVGLFLRDGREGILVPDCSPAAFAQGLRRALSLSPQERQAMRQAARRRAERDFDYHNYAAPLDEYVRSLSPAHPVYHLQFPAGV
jgi:glycosyltransferase involved in cell wall biosynthesis